MTNSPEIFGIDPSEVFPFELDSFQLDAIVALDMGKSVVVCAPTGSGKTLVAEYAIYRARERNRRVFYTTPLKALSNQKFRDFRNQFGQDQVGLLTGDTSINRDAPIVVMTTEIFRNMLYGTAIGEASGSMLGVEAVILDECHYMNDRQRGTVWEESIIYCPSEIQLVGLSATVANSNQLTDWINQIHGPTELIYSDFRPVPLQFSFVNPLGIFPLLDDSGTAISPMLKPKGGKQRPRGSNPRGEKRPEAPAISFVVSKLNQAQMLPAIYFIFSRRGCDRAMDAVAGLTLLTPEESDKIQVEVEAFIDRNPEIARESQVSAIVRGIASHHAGLLPAWKAFVEELFQQGLVKVVFATETLAAGINMPARTTVISTLSKRTDTGHRLLNGSEFLQMSGRAGRRGMDKVGYVLTVQTPYEGAREAAKLATGGADPLVSQFTPSYGMVLNLLQVHTLEQAKELIERSFAQYLASFALKPQRAEVDRIEGELTALKKRVASVDWKLLSQYEKLQDRQREEKRLLKTLQLQAGEAHADELVLMLPYALAGTALLLKGNTVQVPTPISAVLVTKLSGPGQLPYLLCLSRDNRWRIASIADVVQLRPDIPRLEAIDRLPLPDDLMPRPGQSRRGDDVSALLASKIPQLDYDTAETLPPEVYAQLQRMQGVQANIENHPVHKWGDRAKIVKAQRRIELLEGDLAAVTSQMGRQSQRHWNDFLALVELLQEFGALDGLQPTELGQAIAAIRGDNELWLGLAVMSGELDDLDPHHLAAVCAALVTEAARPDSWSRYALSETVIEVVETLRPLRRQLFQRQRRQDVMIPIWLEEDLVSIVEQWALETEWAELAANTSMDEGDIVRMMRRTLDILSQIPYVPHASRTLKDNAVRAVQLIDRFPINETIE
ncbi:MAG: DEAD/DEAH box helicase [Cyanobacteria bacterium]|nr:DEAD/DEAH box helicase [Cyanobacteriota bacterium]